MSGLPAPPEHRQSPRELLGLLEAHVGTSRAAVLCAEVLGDDAPHVTLTVDSKPAGEVLAQVLEQTGLGYEPISGFVITDD